MFKEYGQIKSAVIMKNDDGSSKGFGFVCFNDPNSAEKALKELNNKEIGDKPIYVSRAQRKDEREKELQQKYEKQRNERRSKYTQGVNLYVKNLELTIDDQALHKAFSPYGEITSAIVMRDSEGVSKGFGFVCYAKSDQAATAITEMYSRKLGNKTIFVGIAERKEDRKKKLDEERRAGIPDNRAYPMQPALPYQYNASFVHGQRYMPGAPVVARPRWPQSVMPPPMGGTGSSTYITQSQGAAQPSGYGVQPSYPLRHKSVNSAVPNVVNMSQNNLLTVSRAAAPRQTHMQAVNQNVGMPSRISMSSVASHANPMGRTAMPTSVQNPNGVRYNPNARNVSTMGQVQNVQATDSCGNVPMDKQRNYLGERLYAYIKNLYPEQVAKLTGVLLTMKMEELSALFEDREALKAKVDEAEELLRKKDQVDLEADGAANASKKGKK